MANALAGYTPTVDGEHLTAAEEERTELLKRFPRSRWPKMAVTDYAIGQDDSSETYCRWMEFRSTHLGSIKGGSSHKLIIYKRRNAPGWHYDEAFGSVEDAWREVRGQFIAAMDLAEAEKFDQIEDLAALRAGQALLVKTLHLYFPDRVLPIASRDHLRHFLRLLGRPEADNGALGAVTLNRSLLAGLRELEAAHSADPASRSLSTKQLERFLYRHFPPPSSAKWLKISPGRQAEFWDDCRAGQFMCVGWDEIGDLREFATKDEFGATFAELYGDRYNRRAHVISRKANELWNLMEIRPGDRIVANQGKSKVLAVGTVREPVYEFDAIRDQYRHLIAVDWDESYAKDIPQQGAWLNTVDRVTAEQRSLIRTAQPVLPGGPEDQAPLEVEIEVDPLYLRLRDVLQAKRQVVLFGPPGTGKTFHARRFVAWWLRDRAGIPQPEAVLADPAALAAAERELSGRAVAQKSWLMVANPAVWSWAQLFADGSVSFEHRRIKRNFPKVSVGDLVVGYESGKTKRIMSLARVNRAFGVAPGDSTPTVGLVPLHQVAAGPSYQDLIDDPLLNESEAARLRFQGTLFGLTEIEAERLLARIAESDPAALDALDDDTGDVGRWNFITFHPSYSYEDFVEGYRPASTSLGGLSLVLEDGVFKRVCLAAQADPHHPYVLVIDEINRANLAKVFGELITLLEADKRGLPVTLPQSKQRLVVPENVYLVGTMNTADRSITLLDVALRRRFAFIELMPEPEAVEQAVGPLKLADFLAGLNRRIAAVVGREKQIGHAYLLPDARPIESPEQFARVFRLELLPLLQEYCYDEYDQLIEILGTGLVDPETQTLNDDVLSDPDALVEALAQQFSASAAELDAPA